MALMNSNDSQFVRWIMKQLGIDNERVYSFTFHAQADQIPTLEVVYYPEEPGDFLIEKKYRLSFEEEQ